MQTVNSVSTVFQIYRFSFSLVYGPAQIQKKFHFHFLHQYSQEQQPYLGGQIYQENE